MSEKYWAHVFHDDRLGVRGVGASMDEAFEQAALGLTGVITLPERIAANQEVKLACEASTDDKLLTNWLNALAGEMTRRKMLFSRFDVHVQGHQLQATAWGEPLDVARHEPAVEIKGALPTDLEVRQDEDGQWIAQCEVGL